MTIRSALPAILALSLGVAGVAWAQTTPPEKLQGSTTQNNPATATTPAPPITAGPTPTAATSNNAVSTAPANNAGAPVAGANSFTEGEARSRIESRGFAQVSGLKLDSEGVWRATANKDGKRVNVALDYQGNVVAQ